MRALLKALLNWRYYVLLLLAFVTTFGVFGEPSDEVTSWFGVFIISKSIGFSAGYVIYRLASYWRRNNLIPELDELVKEEGQTYGS